MKYLLSVILLTFSVSIFGQVVSNGDQFSLTVPIKNNGPQTEPNAKMPFTIPTGIKYVSSSPSKGFYTVGDSTWYVNSLTSGQLETIDITFEVTDLNQAPYSISVTATGDGSDTIPGNNDSTFTIQAITDTVTATAVSYSYGCVCDNVSENDTLCNFCDTKFLLDSGSYVNGTVIRFDTLTGEYLFQLDDPNTNGSFDYDIVCYNCGDGAEYAQNTATQTVYALFSKVLKADTSQVYTIAGGDTIVHVAGGDTTYVQNLNGIYSGSDNTPGSLVEVGNTSGLRFVDTANTSNYIEAITDPDVDSVGQNPFNVGWLFNDNTNSDFGGIGIGDDGVGIYSTEPVTLTRTDGKSSFRLGPSWAEYNENTPNGFGIIYLGFGESGTTASDGNYSTLTNTSLIPKVYANQMISDSLSKNTSASIAGDDLTISQSNGGDVTTSLLNSTTITNLLDSHIVAAHVTEIDSTNKRIVLILNNGDSITALYKDYRATAGSGDDWGSQVVQSDSTLLGDGTLGTELSVSAANNALVNSYEFDGNDIILTTTSADTFRLTQAALQSAINTNTTELTNVSYSNDTIFIEDDNQVWHVVGFDSTILTNVSFTNDSLLIQDDIQTWVVDLESLRTTSMVWDSVTSKPTINASGGNITGSLDLSAETLTLTYNDVDTNYYLDTLYLLNDTIFAQVPGVDTFVVDISAYDNSGSGYMVSDTTRTMTSSPYPINLRDSYKHVDIIENTGTAVPGTVTITALNDIEGATLVLHIDEDEDVSFSNYFREPDLSQIGAETLVRNSTMVFDVVADTGENLTDNGNILIRRQ